MAYPKEQCKRSRPPSAPLLPTAPKGAISPTLGITALESPINPKGSIWTTLATPGLMEPTAGFLESNWLIGVSITACSS
ncbi:hypothetical protein T02_10660 [Trichinella nativa]|uniref:Uncharacterized protein n=1 Tax=Trichinella nativa TaxID=6335 RepID=A0A0V1LHR3_9BILA|nr:hypothetical protein T02_10660 [Trichinella nativa]